ncbi:MAG: carboxymuconolactone decarboxylase family protein [Hyphomonas sp.]
MSNRLAPLDAPYAPEIETALARYPRQEGYLLTLFRTFANSARFLQRGVPNLLDRESPLSLREREIVILRVTANYGCEYEWGVHVAIFAKPARLTEAQVAATRLAVPESYVWDAREGRLIAAVDALCGGATLQGDRLDAFTEDWSKVQQLEIINLCGAYHTISMVANVAGLPPESFASRFPAA